MELKPYTPPAKPQTAATNKADTDTGDIVVGDKVNFTGSKHYVSSTGDTGYSCKPGVAEVTILAPKAKHPYHLVNTSDGGSTVYGWVDKGDIGGKV